MRSIAVLLMAGLLTACATSQPKSASTQPAVTPAVSEASGDTKIVKSTDGSFDGEIVGTIKPNSRFSKLKIGMTMAEVNSLIKAPDDLQRHETGKRWIPFYFGDDAQRMQAFYSGEGCLTYTGGNVFGGGGNQLIRITADATRGCFN